MFTYHRAVHWCLSPHQTQVFYSAKSSNIINCQTHNSKWIIPQHWPSEYCVNINFVHKARYQHLYSRSTPCQPKVTNLLNKERQTLLPLSQAEQVVGFTNPVISFHTFSGVTKTHQQVSHFLSQGFQNLIVAAITGRTRVTETHQQVSHFLSQGSQNLIPLHILNPQFQSNLQQFKINLPNQRIYVI